MQLEPIIADFERLRLAFQFRSFPA